MTIPNNRKKKLQHQAKNYKRKEYAILPGRRQKQLDETNTNTEKKLLVETVVSPAGSRSGQRTQIAVGQNSPGCSKLSGGTRELRQWTLV